MKKIVLIMLALVLALSCFTMAMAEDLPVVKIGVFEPASGDSGAGGKQETLGVQYANATTPTVKVGDQEYRVELVLVDNGSSPDKAPSAAQNLIAQGVSVVLGSYGSGVSMAGSTYFADAGIPVIGLTCTNPQVTINNPHYFRVCFTDPFQGPALASIASGMLGAKTVYCLGEAGNEYDQGLIANFKEPFEAQGGTTIVDSFPTGTSDFTSYLINAQAYGADLFFCPVSIAYSTQIVAQADSQGLTVPVLGGDTLDSNVVAESGKGKSVALYITTFYQEGADENFDNGFKAWLAENPDMMVNNGGNDMIAGVTCMGYDGYYVALKAIENAGSIDSAAIMAALPATEIDGVSGHIAFDENGDAIRTEAYVKKTNNETGNWEFVGIQKVD